nr:mucin-1-like [Penaeus vannamei]
MVLAGRALLCLWTRRPRPGHVGPALDTSAPAPWTRRAPALECLHPGHVGPALDSHAPPLCTSPRPGPRRSRPGHVGPALNTSSLPWHDVGPASGHVFGPPPLVYTSVPGSAPLDTSGPPPLDTVRPALDTSAPCPGTVPVALRSVAGLGTSGYPCPDTSVPPGDTSGVPALEATDRLSGTGHVRFRWACGSTDCRSPPWSSGRRSRVLSWITSWPTWLLDYRRPRPGQRRPCALVTSSVPAWGTQSHPAPLDVIVPAWNRSRVVPCVPLYTSSRPGHVAAARVDHVWSPALENVASCPGITFSLPLSGHPVGPGPDNVGLLVPWTRRPALDHGRPLASWLHVPCLDLCLARPGHVEPPLLDYVGFRSLDHVAPSLGHVGLRSDTSALRPWITFRAFRPGIRSPLALGHVGPAPGSVRPPPLDIVPAHRPGQPLDTLGPALDTSAPPGHVPAFSPLTYSGKVSAFRPWTPSAPGPGQRRASLFALWILTVVACAWVPWTTFGLCPGQASVLPALDGTSPRPGTSAAARPGTASRPPLVRAVGSAGPGARSARPAAGHVGRAAPEHVGPPWNSARPGHVGPRRNTSAPPWTAAWTRRPRPGTSARPDTSASAPQTRRPRPDTSALEHVGPWIRLARPPYVRWTRRPRPGHVGRRPWNVRLALERPGTRLGLHVGPALDTVWTPALDTSAPPWTRRSPRHKGNDVALRCRSPKREPGN